MVVLFKDPHLIAKSPWLNKMEATYEKNNTDNTFDNDTAHFKFSNMDGGLDISSDILDSNELEEHQMISSPTITKNNYNESNHVHISDKSTDVVDHHQRFVDDFGPETDVDAMDDPNAIKSPVEHQTNGVKPTSLENKIIQQLSEQNREFLSDSNPFKNDHFDQFSDDHLMLDDTIEKSHSPSEVVDNKIIDALESLAVSNGDEGKYELESEKQMENSHDTRQKSPEILDFTEKVDNNHEKNLFALDHAAEIDDTFVQYSENPFNQTVNEDAQLVDKVDTELLADTACVAESVGEDTEEEEDEWNYIKADEKSKDNLQSPNPLDNQNLEGELLITDPVQPQESEQIEPVTVSTEVPVLNIAGDSQLLDFSIADSVEKEDTFEQEKENVEIVETTAPVDEISDNNVPEETYSAEDASEEQAAVVFEQEIAETTIASPLTSAVAPVVLEDVDQTPLGEDHPAEVEPNLLEEKTSDIVTEDNNIAEIETEPPVELVQEDTSSLEVLPEDTLSTDIEVEHESEHLPETEETVEIESPITEQKEEELQLTVEPETSVDVELERPNSLSLEMASKLNPEAKEFVPVSSPSKSNPTSPVANAPSMIPNSYLMLDDDTVVAQSPKKCTTTMDNIDVPEEDAFQHEMNNRPHELEKPSEYINGNAEITARSHSPASEPSYQELNLKEAMQADEKLEHDYNDEKQVVPEDSPSELSNEQNILHVLNKEQDPMNMSFYEGRDEGLLSNSDELNKVHVLPEEDDSEEQPKEEADNVQKAVCESTPIEESAHDDVALDNKEEIENPETVSQTTLEEHVVIKSPVHEEPPAAIFAVASQVVNDVAALVDQMQIESPISSDLQDLEIKQDEKVELEQSATETEGVMMEQNNDILISLENQSDFKPLEDAVVVEEHSESPHPNAADDDINLHTAETEELVSPLVESVQHEVVAENEFITDESVLNVPSSSQPAFSPEVPVDYEPSVEKPAKEVSTAANIESVSTELVSEAKLDTTATANLLDTVTPVLEQVIKPVEEPKPAIVASKSATQKATVTTKASTTKTAATKTTSKTSTLTADKKAPTSAKLPSRPAPAKLSTVPKPSTAASTVKKTTAPATSRTVGIAKPSTAPSTTRTSLAATATNKTSLAEKKAPLLAKKPATTAVNGDVKTTTSRKPLTSSTLKSSTTATKSSTTTTSSSSSVPSARLSATSVKSTTAKPMTTTTSKTSTSAPVKPSSGTSRVSLAAQAAKPRTAPSTASKTATSTMASKTTQGSSSTLTKRVSTVGTAAPRTTTATSKTMTTATKTSSVTSRTSTVSKLSSTSTTSTVRKITSATSPTKKAVPSPTSKTTAKTSSTGKTVTSTKVTVSNHVNDVKVPLTEDSISSDLLNLDKQFKNDNNQLITNNGIETQMMVIDSAAD